MYSKFAGTDLEVAGTEHVLLKVSTDSCSCIPTPLQPTTTTTTTTTIYSPTTSNSSNGSNNGSTC